MTTVLLYISGMPRTGPTHQHQHRGHGVSPQFQIPQIAQQPATTVTYL